MLGAVELTSNQAVEECTAAIYKRLAALVHDQGKSTSPQCKVFLLYSMGELCLTSLGMHVTRAGVRGSYSQWGLEGCFLLQRLQTLEPILPSSETLFEAEWQRVHRHSSSSHARTFARACICTLPSHVSHRTHSCVSTLKRSTGP